MKYHIDTIPVWDAIRQDGECLLCILERSTENSYIDSFLGASVMEPDTRVNVNKQGFCPNHFVLLYNAQNRLGLALIAHTYLKETYKSFEKNSAFLKSTKRKQALTQLVKLFAPKKPDQVVHFTDFIKQHTNQCVLCDKLKNTMDRYAFTALHLWSSDNEFKKTLLSSRGFCLPHLAITIDIAKETLPDKKLTLWLDDMLSVTANSLKLLDNELHWFTQKFDYRNQEKPWGNSKDALQRVIQKLIAKFVSQTD